MTDLLIIFALVLVNGVLAGAEMAIVTARKQRLEVLAAAGNRRARTALNLRAQPERFLATIQVGITLIGAIAGAFGGSVLAADLTPVLEDWGFGAAASEVAFIAVVGLVTYLSVVFGELVPKSLALGVAESYALWTAGPVALLAKGARPLVWVLTTSSNLVLRLFGDRTDFMESRLTRDDLEAMVGDAQTAGSLDVPTGRLVRRALEFTRLQVRDVMIHRRNVATVQRGASPEQLREALLATPHRRLMVIDGTADQACGYLLRDDVLTELWQERTPRIEDLLRPPVFVPETTSAERAFRDLQDRGAQFAMVIDETGGVGGIVTIEDLVEELVGEIFDELDHRHVRQVERESAESWLMAGSVELRTLTRELGFQLPAPSGVRTIGGLCVERAGSRIPEIGETFDIGGALTAEVVDASPRRVRMVRLRIPPASARPR